MSIALRTREMLVRMVSQSLVVMVSTVMGWRSRVLLESDALVADYEQVKAVLHDVPDQVPVP